MFVCREHMTEEQLTIAEQFQNSVETEYVLCVNEIKKINQAIANNPSPTPSAWHGVDCANFELHSIQKYWQNRLDCLINILREKDYKLNEELAKKYLKGIKFRVSS